MTKAHIIGICLKEKGWTQQVFANLIAQATYKTNVSSYYNVKNPDRVIQNHILSRIYNCGLIPKEYHDVMFDSYHINTAKYEYKKQIDFLHTKLHSGLCKDLKIRGDVQEAIEILENFQKIT